MSSHPKLDEKEVADRLQQLGFDTNDPEKVREREMLADRSPTLPPPSFPVVARKKIH